MHYARFECPAGDSTFSLHQTEDTPKGSGAGFYLEVQDMDNYVQQLVEEGVEFEEMPDDKTWLWRESRLKGSGQ